ncbi:MAG TPA: hypothetical protein VLI72_08685 [Methylibium sp.]|nr:hypothetical protein [Methylibium sp.]
MTVVHDEIFLRRQDGSCERIIRERRDAAEKTGRSQADDQLFVRLLNAYRGRGGMAREREILAQLSAQQASVDQSFPQHTVYEALLSVDWNCVRWFPLFQFDVGACQLKAAPRVAADVLRQAFEPWEICSWFVEANELLDRRAPIDVVESHPFLVAKAAGAVASQRIRQRWNVAGDFRRTS